MGEPGQSSQTETEITIKDVMSRLDALQDMMRISFSKINNLEDKLEESLGSEDNRSKKSLGAEENARDSIAPGSPRNEQAITVRGYGPPTESFHHGIRALERWKSTAPISKDFGRASFRLESSQDYNMWKYVILSVLERESVVSFINGQAVRPEVHDASDLEGIRLQARWDDCDSSTRSFIIGALGKHQIGLVLQCKTSCEVWEKLQSLYNQKSDINVAKLKNELNTLKWRKNTTIDHFISEINRLSEALRGCGVEVLDNDLRLILLMGLPERYSSIQHAMFQASQQFQISYSKACDDVRSHVNLSSIHETKVHLGISGDTKFTPNNHQGSS